MSLLSYHQSAKKATSNLECRFALEICFHKKEPLGSFHFKSQTNRLGSQP